MIFWIAFVVIFLLILAIGIDYSIWRKGFGSWQERNRIPAKVIPEGYRVNALPTTEGASFEEYRKLSPYRNLYARGIHHVAEHLRNEENCACFIFPIVLVLGAAGTALFFCLK